jgi:hypothetical protein
VQPLRGTRLVIALFTGVVTIAIFLSSVSASTGATDTPSVAWWGFGQSANETFGDADDTNASGSPPGELLMLDRTVPAGTTC